MSRASHTAARPQQEKPQSAHWANPTLVRHYQVWPSHWAFSFSVSTPRLLLCVRRPSSPLLVLTTPILVTTVNFSMFVCLTPSLFSVSCREGDPVSQHLHTMSRVGTGMFWVCHWLGMSSWKLCIAWWGLIIHWQTLLLADLWAGNFVVQNQFAHVCCYLM